MIKEFESLNEQDTYNIAGLVAKDLKAGDIILLDGDLGAGKTQFVKGVVHSLGGDLNQATSPTFTIVNEYLVNGTSIYHFDLYRINSVEELYNIGIEEYFYGRGICFIEWPKRAKELFVGKRTEIQILKTGENSRKIIVKKIM